MNVPNEQTDYENDNVDQPADYEYEYDDSSATDHGSALVPTIVALSVGAMAVVQALDARLASFEKVAYAGLFGSMVLITLISRFRASDFTWSVLITSILMLPAIPLVYRQHIDFVWVIGDIIILLAPLVFWLLIQSHPRILEGRTIKIMLGMFFLAAIVAPLFANATEHGRFEPPRFLLFAAGWYYIFRGQNISNTLTITAATFLLLAVTWFSDVRVAVLLWFAAGALAAVSVSSLQRFLTLATLGFVLVVGLIAFAPRDSKIYDKSRFAKVDFLSIAENDFVKYRMGECKEVIKYFRQTVNIPRLALGHGFGAAYPSNGSHLAHLKSKVFRRNALANKVNEHGLTHTLHFGPVRVFFRYGLVGVGLYLLLAYFILSDVARLLLGRTQHGDDPDVAFVNTILLITIFCMLVRFHLKNVEHDLDFAFVLAAYLSRRQWFNTLGEDFDDEEEYEEDDYHDDYEHADDYSPEYA